MQQPGTKHEMGAGPHFPPPLATTLCFIMSISDQYRIKAERGQQRGAKFKMRLNSVSIHVTTILHTEFRKYKKLCHK